jgi:hypothetical protein
MGMDVYGRNPAGPEGAYFRASISQWPVLVKIITTLCPQEMAGCKHWHTNDGDGLNSAQALTLADALERKIQSGEVAVALCDPTIIRHAESPIGATIVAWFESQGCTVRRVNPTIDEHYVAKFAEFVRASGGFAIW